MTQIDIWAFLWSLLLDLTSLILLSYVFYYRRHNDREMTVAISVINVTLFALAGALASFTLSLGVGFALFAVISIIRLRSSTAGWVEMAYLLAGLSTGLILGLPGFGLIEKATYASVLVVAMYVIDNPRLFGRKSLNNITVTMDGTQVASAALRARVEEMLGIEVDEVVVKSVNSNPPTTKIDVRYREGTK